MIQHIAVKEPTENEETDIKTEVHPVQEESMKEEDSDYQELEAEDPNDDVNKIDEHDAADTKFSGGSGKKLKTKSGRDYSDEMFDAAENFLRSYEDQGVNYVECTICFYTTTRARKWNRNNVSQRHVSPICNLSN